MAESGFSTDAVAAIEQLTADALTFQDKINERTSDPTKLRELANVAIAHLDHRAAELYTHRPVRVSGSVYVPVETSMGIPDIDRACILDSTVIEGISEGFYFHLDVVDISSWQEESTTTDVLEQPKAEAYSRIEIGHLLKGSRYHKSSMLGSVVAEVTQFAPVAMSKLQRLEDITSQEVIDAREALPLEKLADMIDEILLVSDSLRLDQLDMFFRKLILSPKYSKHVDACLRYADALIGGKNGGAEIISDYVCVTDRVGNFGPYVFTDVMNGQYDGLCLTVGYHGEPEQGLTELRREQVGIRLKYVDKDCADNLVVVPLSSIQALGWIESPLTHGLPEYVRPRRYYAA